MKKLLTINLLLICVLLGGFVNAQSVGANQIKKDGTSITGNASNQLQVDTTKMATKYYVGTVGGSGTVTSVAAGYGTLFTTITTTGSVIVDSATLSGKYVRRADSTITFATPTELALKQNQINGTGFVKATGTTISYDNSVYLTTNQNITVTATGDATGTSSASPTAPSLPLVLATVNSNVGSFTNSSITVNGKGLITAASSGTAGITTLGAIGSSANANGMTLTGSTLNLEPASVSFGGIMTTGTQSVAGVKTFTSQFINQRNALGATTSGGLTNYNATAATSGTPVQVPPRFASIGAAWTGAASQLVDFGFYSVPVAGTNPVTGYLQFDYAVNGGAKSNIGKFTSIGTFQPIHLGGSSGVPTIVAGAAAGASPTVSMGANSTDIGGFINVTTGTLPLGVNGILATITFSVAYTTAPVVIISGGNNAAIALSGATMVGVPVAGQTNGVTTTTFVLQVGITALVASTPYIFSYHCIQ